MSFHTEAKETKDAKDSKDAAPHRPLLFHDKELFEEGFDVSTGRFMGRIAVANLIGRLSIPQFQRLHNPEKVDDIVRYQARHHSRTGEFNFLGSLSIYSCEEKGKNYLIDGQHRYMAAEVLYNEWGKRDLFLVAEVVHVYSVEDMRENYSLINKNTALPDLPAEGESEDAVKYAARYFFDKYPSPFGSKSRKPNRPYLCRNRFQEALGHIIAELGGAGVSPEGDELIELVEAINSSIPTISVSIRGVTLKMRTKAMQWGFNLGLWPYSEGEPGGYGWVAMALRHALGDAYAPAAGSGAKPKSPPKRGARKERIPAPLREIVWDTYNGRVKDAHCHCCHRKITTLTFEAGHVQAEARGGTVCVENLRPVCKKCNTSMGVQNMWDFKRKWFPLNTPVVTLPLE
jgi:hypothetical protein